MPAGSVNRRCALYRIYDADRRLLYVGIGYDPTRRWTQHARRDWWLQMASIEVDWHPTRAEAEKAEERTVRIGRPLHNVIYGQVDMAESSDDIRMRLTDTLCGLRRLPSRRQLIQPVPVPG